MTIQIRYTEAILRRAIWNFVRRTVLNRLIIPSIILLCILAFSMTLDSPFIQGIAIFSILLVPAMFALVYWQRMQESLKRFRMLDHGRVIITLSEDGVFAESAIVKSETKWSFYSDLWEFRDDYLLMYNESQFITLPKDQMSDEFIQFIRLKLAAKA
jgi:hypothetical protein